MRAENRTRIEFILDPGTHWGRRLSERLNYEPNKSETIRRALIAWYDKRPAPTPDPAIADLARAVVTRDREINELRAYIEQQRAEIAQLEADREYYQRELGACENQLVDAQRSGLLGRLRRD